MGYPCRYLQKRKKALEKKGVAKLLKAKSQTLNPKEKETERERKGEREGDTQGGGEKRREGCSAR